MTTDPDCIFCKIVAGEIPCFKIAEDDRTLAFLDINPANPGHALVIPKAHAANVFEIGTDDLAAVAAMAKRVASAVRDALAPAGINLVQANGPGAAQSVPHFHFHVVPRGDDDGLPLNWPLTPGDMGALQAMAERIAAAVAD